MIIKSFVDLLRIIQKLKSNEFGKLVNYLDDRSVDMCINVCNTDLTIPRSRLKKLNLGTNIVNRPSISFSLLL